MAVTCPVFNVQHYSIHDGPGIRSTVFVKGCPLRCAWCQNPESQRREAELMYNDSLCVGCGACAQICSALSMVEGKAVTNRTACVGCGRCTEVCAKKARELAGRPKSVDEVLHAILPYRLFLQDSGGGVTISGGEPMAHAEFAAELFAACHAEGLHTAFESSAFAAREQVDLICRDADLAICDIKLMDSEEHRRWTGVPNERILENLRYIRRELDKPMWVRVPVIPGVNADEANIRATAQFIASALGSETELQLLPYHSLGASKAERLGKAYAMEGTEPPTDAQMQRLLEICTAAGITTRIGG